MNKHRPDSGDAWIVAIHASADDRVPLGAGVAIDSLRVLTSAHVVLVDGVVRPELWIALPKADDPFGARLKVTACVLGEPALSDVASLHVDVRIPHTARVRVPHPADLVDREWWAYGFPNQDPIGNESSGTIGATLAYGWVRLDANARYLLSAGFSGAGVWSSEYQAVVGLVGETNDQGDGRAVTLQAASVALPSERLTDLAKWEVEAAGGEALAAWGWTLLADPEVRRHWGPRARGVALDTETGYRFRGRSAALTDILSWLRDDATDRPVLVVTGSPGVGKSAVLGRIVTTADATLRDHLPDDDTGVRAPVGIVSCAVHAKGKTAYEIAREIAVASSARIPADVIDFAKNVSEALHATDERFNIVIDALDEAASPADARIIVSELLYPLTSLAKEGQVRVVVGTRRLDRDGDLLGAFSGDPVVVDLDEPAYIANEDLASYALATLMQRVSPELEGAYASRSQAEPVAARIASIADGNFLIALIIARYHATYDAHAVSPDDIAFAVDVRSALDSFLSKLPLFGEVHAKMILLPLAYAESPGLNEQTWLDALKKFTGLPGLELNLREFARGSAANFLVESGEGEPDRVYRLFHQALADALTHDRKDRGDITGDHAMLAEAMIERWGPLLWEGAPPYAYRSLPMHAAHAGLTSRLILDDEYVLHTDIRRLLAFSSAAPNAAASERLRLLRIAPRIAEAGPGHRQAILSVIGALEGIPAPSSRTRLAPYVALWSRSRASVEYAVYEGPTSAVRSLTVLGGGSTEAVIATGGVDGRITLWLASTGEPVAELNAHSGQILALVGAQKCGERILVSAGHDRALGIWNLDGYALRHRLKGHDDWVRTMCVLAVGQDQFVASGGDDGTVRLWDPFVGSQARVLVIPGGGVVSVASVRVRGQRLLATSTRDRAIRIWDPTTGELVQLMRGTTGAVANMTVVPSKYVGWDYIISTGESSALTVWDPESGSVVRAMGSRRHEPATVWSDVPPERQTMIPERNQNVFVEALARVATAHRQLVATSGADRVLRTWDPGSGQLLGEVEGHTAWVYDIQPLELLKRHLIATSGDDRTIRIWEASATVARSRAASMGACHAIDGFVSHGVASFAIGSSNGRLAVVNASTGEERAVEYLGQGSVRSIQALELQDETLLIVAGDDEVIRLYDADSLRLRHRFAAPGPVSDIEVTSAQGPVLIALLKDGSLCSWDLLTFGRAATVQTETSSMSAVAAIGADTLIVLDFGHDRPVMRVLEVRQFRSISQIDLDIDAAYPVFESLQSRRGAAILAVARRLVVGEQAEWHVIDIVDVVTGQVMRSLVDHRSRIGVLRAIDLFGDRYLMSADDDGNLRVWDFETGECVRSAWVMHSVTALSSLAGGGSVAIGLSRGSLAITFEPSTVEDVTVSRSSVPSRSPE